MKKQRSDIRVAIVYDRVNKWGGAERVLLELNKMFPEAPLYTSVYDPQGAAWAKVFPKVISSFLQKVPFAKKNHEWFATLMPLAFEAFDFSEYDLVVSVTSEAAKGIITGPNTKHVCICLTPTRYLWSHYEEYFGSLIKQMFSWPMVLYKRWWDKVAATRPDVMVAISTEVQERIKEYYDRESVLIFPPTDLFLKNSLLRVSSTTSRSLFEKHDQYYYLVVSRLVKYKRVGLVIKAFNEMGRRLVVVGKGKEEGRLKAMVGENIVFVKDLSDAELGGVYGNAKALIAPQREDFGLVMVEAMSHGTPVIAFGKGGSRDIVKEGVNGVCFDKQSVKSIIKTTERFEKMRFDSKMVRKSVERFSGARFKKELGNV